MQKLPKPWFDLEGCRRARLLETKYEAELALKFLDAGLYRNAAGKAFQAVKALLTALAVDHRDRLAQKYPGTVKLKGGKILDRGDRLITVMPTSHMLGLSAMIDDDIHYLTAIALYLH